jgi:hypothetical protein
MSTYSALNVPTRFVQADDIRFAYRRWGQPDEFPLVFAADSKPNRNGGGKTDGFSFDDRLFC